MRLYDMRYYIYIYISQRIADFAKIELFFVEKTPKIVQNLKKSAYMYISMKSSAPDLFIPVVYSDTRQTPDFWRFFKKKTFNVLEFSIFGVFFTENT